LRILTVVTTLRQQGRHALDYVTAALHDQRQASLLAGPRVKQGVNGYESPTPRLPARRAARSE
jgi:hypothetical protein